MFSYSLYAVIEHVDRFEKEKEDTPEKHIKIPNLTIILMVVVAEEETLAVVP